MKYMCYHIDSMEVCGMPGLLVRDVEIDLLEKLKKRAKNNGRSLQNEVKSIITEVVEQKNTLSDIETADKIRRSLEGRKFSDSAALLREDRDR
jgi:antitoxin FitA